MKAMKAGNSDEADIFGIVLASLKNAKIAKSDDSDLTEEEEIKVIFSESKKISDSIEKFKEGGRDDLVKHEEKQLEVVQKYLPTQADEDEVKAVVRRIIDETGASGMGSMGMVMGSAMKELEGRADGKVVSDTVKNMLA